MITLLEMLLNFAMDVAKGQKSKEEVARGLIDAAFTSGVPAAELLGYLTEKGQQEAELAADLAQWAKVHGPKL